MSEPSAYSTITTSDGSVTFFSEEFQQAFHNFSGARQEALEKYVLPTNLLALAMERQELHIVDVCFGLGYNSAVALERIWHVNPNCRVWIHALERSPDVPQQAYYQGLWDDWDFKSMWKQWFDAGVIESNRLSARLHWGDARQTLQMLPEQWADAVFYDPFAPPSCPYLWTVEMFAQVVRCLKPQGRLATYSCAVAVRSGMVEAGLNIGSTPPVGRPGPGTVASPNPQKLPPLSPRETEHLQTRAAIPYRDPTLSASIQDILERRDREQQHSQLEATSIWKKRWKPPSVRTHEQAQQA
ncbi:MAG: tRNA (5-methylaminomethyl-2-thiouridine)(34)-methyltransferase MnmD [Synechococcus sp.]